MKTLKLQYPPGDFAIWIVIYVELITFGALFISYAYSRRLDVVLFNKSQLLLDQRFGFINTLLLITSSFLVVKAVNTIKTLTTKEASKIASHFLLGAISLGSVFLVIKVIEFSGKYAQGINISTNTFFMYYLAL